MQKFLLLHCAVKAAKMEVKRQAHPPGRAGKQKLSLMSIVVGLGTASTAERDGQYCSDYCWLP